MCVSGLPTTSRSKLHSWQPQGPTLADPGTHWAGQHCPHTVEICWDRALTEDAGPFFGVLFRLEIWWDMEIHHKPTPGRSCMVNVKAILSNNLNIHIYIYIFELKVTHHQVHPVSLRNITTVAEKNMDPSLWHVWGHRRLRGCGRRWSCLFWVPPGTLLRTCWHQGLVGGWGVILLMVQKSGVYHRLDVLESL